MLLHSTSTPHQHRTRKTAFVRIRVHSAVLADIERLETRPRDISELSCVAKVAWPTVTATLDRAKILIRLRQGPLLGLIVNPFGTTAKVLELDGDMLRATTRGQTAHLSLADVCAPPPPFEKVPSAQL